MPQHAHDIETACEAVGCQLYDPKDWRCRCGSPVMFADTEDWPEPVCADCYDELGGVPRVLGVA